ncbi:hypothetical protein [Vulcanisaeta sp. JCM 16159]|uniref:hypothetical protein n=1 Tax=Vulcanisaeta sp. JCM 16159 TaxID=1295371 RepID=UPI000B1148A7|nr:hypothetical protein [Vulcanisaeta sp. JCM 16159]
MGYHRLVVGTIYSRLVRDLLFETITGEDVSGSDIERTVIFFPYLARLRHRWAI